MRIEIITNNLKLTNQDKEMLDILWKYPFISISEVSEMFKINKNEANNLITKARNYQLLQIKIKKDYYLTMKENHNEFKKFLSEWQDKKKKEKLNKRFQQVLNTYKK